MKRWVLTATIDPTKLTGVVSGRFLGDVELSGSVIFCGYCNALQQWYWVWGGGHEEKIDAPQMLFLDDAWVTANRRLGIEPPKSMPVKKDRQLEFSL